MDGTSKFNVKVKEDFLSIRLEESLKKLQKNKNSKNKTKNALVHLVGDV